MISWAKDILERYSFGVCTYIGERIGVNATQVRLYFLYISCASINSSIILYLFIAFWMNIRKYIRKGLNMAR